MSNLTSLIIFSDIKFNFQPFRALPLFKDIPISYDSSLAIYYSRYIRNIDLNKQIAPESIYISVDPYKELTRNDDINPSKLLLTCNQTLWGNKATIVPGSTRITGKTEIIGVLQKGGLYCYYGPGNWSGLIGNENLIGNIEN